MNAKAAVFTGINEPFDVREYDVVPAPKGYGRSVLIASGICGTDIHIHTGRLGTAAPSIIGHEFIGRLDDCDEAEAAKYGLKKGDNVIADIAVPCGECLLCKSGDDANCVNMQVTNGGNPDDAPHFFGGYGEVNYTPLTNLVKLPEELDPAMTATFACPGPTVLHAVALAKKAGVDIEAMNSAVVQGFGPVGAFAVMYLKAVGVKNVYVITSGYSERKFSLAKQLGADEVFSLKQMGSDSVISRMKQENGGLGVDLVLEASGAPAAVPVGFEVLRNRGVYLIPGQYSNSGPIAIQPQLITFKALHIIGSSQYSMVDVRNYLSFLCEHKELHAAIEKLGSRYAVEDINTAIADAKSGQNIKTLLIRKMKENGKNY